jgi:hypothetical protein
MGILLGGGGIKRGGFEDLEENLREVKKTNVTVVVLLIFVSYYEQLNMLCIKLNTLLFIVGEF